MKIALINYYSRMLEYPNRYTLPTMRLAEYLISSGYNVDLVPIDLNKYDKFDYSKLANKYDLIGFSNYSWVEHAVLYGDKKIKELDKDVEIVIGGAQTEVLNINDYDKEYFILGEGEKALKNLCEHIFNGTNDEEFFEKNRNIFDKEHTNRSKVEEHIEIHNPLFTNIDVPYEDRKFLWYETCRGCAFKCGYCGHRTRENVEYIDLNIVKQEIKNIGDKGFEEVFVIDPNFAGTKERAKKVISYFNEYAKDTKIGLYFRPEFLDDEMIEKLSKANLTEIRIGIQTTNPNVPKWLRSNNLTSINNQLPKLSENGINWRGELIVGLPGDNFKGLKESMEFVENLKPSTYFCYPLTAIPNTPLYKIKDKTTENYWFKSDEKGKVIETNSCSKEELIEMQEYANIKTNNYNKKLVRKI